MDTIAIFHTRYIGYLYHTDIYGFHNAFYLKSPRVMKELKDSWNDKVLDTLDIEIVSHIKITGKGNLNGGLYYEEG